MFRVLIRTAAPLVLALGVGAPALADDHVITKNSPHTVAETIDKLEAAVKNAGATIFARVDHGSGAQSVDMDLGASELLIFGNPQIGTPAMQDDPLAGLVLPLKVLAYEDATGQVRVAYVEPEETFDEFEIDDDAEYIRQMEGALDNLTSAAVAE